MSYRKSDTPRYSDTTISFTLVAHIFVSLHRCVAPVGIVMHAWGVGSVSVIDNISIEFSGLFPWPVAVELPDPVGIPFRLGAQVPLGMPSLGGALGGVAVSITPVATPDMVPVEAVTFGCRSTREDINHCMFLGVMCNGSVHPCNQTEE